MKLRDVCRKADLAIRLGAIEYASDLCEHVLHQFPGDLRTRTLLGQAYLEQSKLSEACQQFDRVLDLDPENVAALSADGVAHSAAGHLDAAVHAFERAYELNPGNAQVRDSLSRLYAQRDGSAVDPSSAPSVAVIRWQLRHGDLEQAIDSADEHLLVRPGDLSVLMSRAEAFWRAGRLGDAEQACRQILARHPCVLKPRLILGQILSSDRSTEREGVEMLHAALVEDTGGVVVTPLFRGATFSPPILADDVSIQVPDHLRAGPPDIDAALAALPPSGADEVDGEWLPPDQVRGAGANGSIGAADVDEEGGWTGTDPREGPFNTPKPDLIESLLAISCRGPLVARYGFEGFQRLERRLLTVSRELAFLGTRMVVAFVDDPGSMAQHELSPIWSTDPTDIKRAIDELGHALGQDGSSVDGILIVGGDDVVPFFHLQNPSDDDDSAILSDNPYAVESGESIYAPRVAIGRLPDGSAGNLSLLLRQIDTLLEVRRNPPATENSSRIVQAGIAALGAIGLAVSNSLSFGCAASTWESVSGEAFSPLSTASSLRLSPPVIADDFQSQWIHGRRFFYFNLHGSLDAPAWYGQVAAGGTDDRPPLPIAITPELLSEADFAAPVVFSEASHAGNVSSKTATNSLALRFLSEGASAFIGPTATAYGTVTPPLAGADLLAELFWENLRDGDRIGEALGRAKTHYAADLMERQGYLDGDDQKTLLEFVLFGDPLMPVFQRVADREEDSDEDVDQTILLCNRSRSAADSRSVPPKMLRAAIEHVLDWCPEAATGAVRAHRRKPCSGQCGLPGHQHDSPVPRPNEPGIIAVSARKEMATTDGSTIVKLARVTLGERGELVKCLVSR